MAVFRLSTHKPQQPVKYAVLEVRKRYGVTKIVFSYLGDTVVCSLMGGFEASEELSRSGLGQSDEDALFWVIYKALGRKEDT